MISVVVVAYVSVVGCFKPNDVPKVMLDGGQDGSRANETFSRRLFPCKPDFKTSAIPKKNLQNLSHFFL